MSAVDVIKNRVIQARSLHGAIAAMTMGLMLTMMTYIFLAVYESPSEIWSHTPEIVLISGAGLIAYSVIRFLDICFLKLAKDWGVDGIQPDTDEEQLGSSPDITVV